MKKEQKVLIGLFAAILAGALIFTGCASPTNGEAGADGNTYIGGIVLSQTNVDAATLAAAFAASNARAVYAGNVILATSVTSVEGVVPAGRTLEVAGSTEVAATGTLKLVVNGTVSVLAGATILETSTSGALEFGAGGGITVAAGGLAAVGATNISKVTGAAAYALDASSSISAPVIAAAATAGADVALIGLGAGV